MKKRSMVILILSILGLTAAATGSPTMATAALGTSTAASGTANYTVEKWRSQEISFKSSLTTQILSGTQSSFESPAVPAGWAPFGGGTVSTSSTVAHEGSSSLQLAGRSESYFSPRYNVYDAVKAGGPGKYNFNFWVYVDTLGTSPVNGRVVVRGNAAGQYSFFDAGQSYGTASGTISTGAGTWTKYTGSISVTGADLANTTGTMNLMIDSLPGAAGQNLYIDDVQVTKDYYLSPFDDVTMNVTFTGPDNTQMVMPAFWDGGETWKVRFAPNQTGQWTYATTASNTNDTGLHNQAGTINCVPYTGNLTVYQKGFVKTQPNTRHFVYDDGTPFFYIGDTHWSMPSEPYEEMFRPLVDDRVAKGFTVYQSEPIGNGYNLSNGVTETDIAKFKNIDNRFEYIANAGLVHANSSLFFANEFKINPNYTANYREKLARYWVARYAAYPVMWTTAQESDKNFYGAYDTANNPWRDIFNATHQYDPYQHPLTVHQENTGSVRAANSAFKDLPGYSWFAAQWAPQTNGQLDFETVKDYWNNSSGRPALNYESFYENLWTNEFGARVQGWSAYLNGMYGQGYGAQDIWLYNSTYDENRDTVAYGITITPAMKQVTWQASKDFSTATQLGTYMKSFFTSMDWSILTPRFDDTSWFENNGSYYSVASDENDTYVAYFYNPTANTGTLKGLDNVPYHAKWFNPRTGTYTDIGDVTPSAGQWAIPAKPDSNDWALVVSKAPVTTAALNPASADGDNGWYVQPVSLTLSASANKAGVAKTEYSVDGGNSWETYGDPLIFSRDGDYTVSYRSTDHSGNVEPAKSVNFRVDGTTPTILISGIAEGAYSNSVDVTPTLSLGDDLSGIDSNKTSLAVSTGGITRNIEANTALALYTLPLGTHTLTATATDMAGNTGSRTLNFDTTANTQSLRVLVARFRDSGWINDPGISNALQSKLIANDLPSFVGLVQAQRGQHITTQAADFLLRDAEYVLAN